MGREAGSAGVGLFDAEGDDRWRFGFVEDLLNKLFMGEPVEASVFGATRIGPSLPQLVLADRCSTGFPM